MVQICQNCGKQFGRTSRRSSKKTRKDYESLIKKAEQRISKLNEKMKRTRNGQEEHFIYDEKRKIENYRRLMSSS